MKKKKYSCKANSVPTPTAQLVKVGDIARQSPVSFGLEGYPGAHVLPSQGRVVWVHPRGRYYLVEFSVGPSVIRECFGGMRT